MCLGSWDCACDGFTIEKECMDCDEKQEVINNCKLFLESIVEILYSKGKLNLVDLEDQLDELCSQLDVKMIPGDLQIQRLKEEKISIPSVMATVKQWKLDSYEYLKQV